MLPVAPVLITDIEVRELHRVRWALKLHVATGAEVTSLALG